MAHDAIALIAPTIIRPEKTRCFFQKSSKALAKFIYKKASQCEAFLLAIHASLKVVLQAKVGGKNIG
ncbi:MAG: hypothetical protein P8R04_04675, partial [Gammaproteobacteria bacterium]|nr:hypothetical protein [Gammaproteobacteria bacterium]